MSLSVLVEVGVTANLRVNLFFGVIALYRYSSFWTDTLRRFASSQQHFLTLTEFTISPRPVDRSKVLQLLLGSKKRESALAREKTIAKYQHAREKTAAKHKYAPLSEDKNVSNKKDTTTGFRNRTHHSQSKGSKRILPRSAKFSQRKVSANKTWDFHCPEFHFPSNDSQLGAFKPAMSTEEVCLLLEILQTLSSALQASNITYFLYGGSLIGSWRHHGIVPWDDDVDIAVDVTQREDLRHALHELEPLGLAYKERPRSIKFYSNEGKKFKKFTWKWPFVDVFFFQYNVTHVWDTERGMFPDYVFPKSWIFPTKLRPFSGLQLPAPRETKKVLEQTYKLTNCATGVYSHRYERGRNVSEVVTVDCDALRSAYPFVQHHPLGETACNESVVESGEVVTWVVVDHSPLCS